MSLADLSLDHWRSLDPGAAERLAREAADRVGGRLVVFDAARPATVPLHRAVVERDGRRFALIPGGEAAVGFDLDGWSPSPGQLTSYREESLPAGFGFGADLKEHVARFLTPRRTVALPAVLMAVEPEKLLDTPAVAGELLAAEGLRPPHPDEWEHACGAGSRTLFHWGDDHPRDAEPYGDSSGPHRFPNALGLRVCFDVYESELTTDPASVYGGDGGEAVCGGYGTFLAWLPLATANHNPDTAEFVNGAEGEDMFEDVSVRPVIDLA
ncbi:hypothetical protein [uncultured Streptomyces sp.]|uniref:hypothetical protein n=1 Tax=uncultured Streptomyces sp. TaxID=174707 RepID=UPI00262D0B55|nr:hypothetical protein [uncultured Streptomyces sp.]